MKTEKEIIEETLIDIMKQKDIRINLFRLRNSIKKALQSERERIEKEINKIKFGWLAEDQRNNLVKYIVSDLNKILRLIKKGK